MYKYNLLNKIQSSLPKQMFRGKKKKYNMKRKQVYTIWMCMYIVEMGVGRLDSVSELVSENP